MNSHIPEITGFLCRWLLLALAGIVVVWAVWATIYAASTVHNEIQANVVFPDRVALPIKKRFSMIATAAPYMPPSGGTLTYHSDFDKKMWLGIMNPPYRHIHHGLPSAAKTPLPPGRQIVDIRGMPFGPMTFKHYPTRLDVLAPGTRLSLIDAKFAVSLAKSRPGTLRALLNALDPATVPAFLSVGDINTYAHQKETLEAFGDLPVLGAHHPRTPNPQSIVRSLLGDLGLKQSPRSKQFVIVTDNAKLADACKTYGYVHLVGQTARRKRAKDIYYHDTTSDLVKWLAKVNSAAK